MAKLEVFDFNDYRSFLKAFADLGGKRGGELRRIADAARVFPSYLSQILGGKRELNLDQAIGIAHYCGMSSSARRYFLILVQHARAATTELRTELETQLRELRDRHLRLSARLPDQRGLTIEDAATFYSSWLYIAARLYTAVSMYQTLAPLSRKLGISEGHVKRILKFLVDTHLCIEEAPGKYIYGPAHMHLGADHPLITKHHANWRARALEKHALLDQNRELAYSGVFALSKADARKIRALLPKWIEQAREVSDPSPSETVYCLNLDWFET